MKIPEVLLILPCVVSFSQVIGFGMSFAAPHNHSTLSQVWGLVFGVAVLASLGGAILATYAFDDTTQSKSDAEQTGDE